MKSNPLDELRAPIRRRRKTFLDGMSAEHRELVFAMRRMLHSGDTPRTVVQLYEWLIEQIGHAPVSRSHWFLFMRDDGRIYNETEYGVNAQTKTGRPQRTRRTATRQGQA